LLKELQTFEQRLGLRHVYFSGCALELKGKNGLHIRKPWCISTNSLRLIQHFSQCQCPTNHQHEPAEGGNASGAAYYTKEFVDTVLESLYPRMFYHSIPSVAESSALVTLNMSRSQWLNDEQGVKAVQAEADGLRSNQTWDDDSVDTLSN